MYQYQEHGIANASCRLLVILVFAARRRQPTFWSPLWRSGYIYSRPHNHLVRLFFFFVNAMCSGTPYSCSTPPHPYHVILSSLLETKRVSLRFRRCRGKSNIEYRPKTGMMPLTTHNSESINHTIEHGTWFNFFLFFFFFFGIALLLLPFWDVALIWLSIVLLVMR